MPRPKPYCLSCGTETDGNNHCPECEARRLRRARQKTNTCIARHANISIAVTTGSTATLSATLWHANGVDTSGAGVIQTGTVNVYDAPVFVDSMVWNYHLGSGSAAIDAGIDAGVTDDLDGYPRLVESPDLGAYEWARHVCLPFVLRN